MGIHNVSLVGAVTVGPKGQVVIPAEVRNNSHIRPGDKLIVLYNKDAQAAILVTESQAQQMVDQLGRQLYHLQDSLKGTEEV